MTSPSPTAPAPTATILPVGATDAEGRPVTDGVRIRHKDRTGTVKNVRPGSGVLIFADDLDGKQKTALIAEVVQVPADEPVPTPGDLHKPDAPAANAVEVDPRLAEIQSQIDALAAAGDPQCEFVAAPGPCSLDRSARHNWVEDAGGLPNYICQIARAVARDGRDLDSAIPIAVGTVKKWAAGGGDVSAAVRARAAAAVAEWEAKKARARAAGAQTAVLATEVLETLAAEIDAAVEGDMATYLHIEHLLTCDMTRTFTADLVGADGELEVKPGTDLPPQAPSAKRKARRYKHHPAGAPKGMGGQFAPGKARSATAKKAQQDKPSQSLYQRVLAAGPKRAKTIVAELPERDLKKLSEIIYSSDEIDPEVAAGRLVVKAEMKRRGLDVKDNGAPEGGKARGIAQEDPQRDDPQGSEDDPNTRPDNPEAPAIGSQDVLIPAPTTHNGVKMTGGPYEDGSARYADGYVWDAVAGQFRQSVAQKTKASEASQDGPTMTITASAAEFVPDEFTYYWDPDTSETFRVSTDGTRIDVFAPLVDEQSEPVWQSVSLEGETAANVTRLPTVDDAATLDSILGAAFVDTAEQVAALVAAAVAADPEVEAPEGAGEGQGPRFRIPVLIPEGVYSGDRRIFTPGALEAKELPMPLLWQRETDEGHKRSVIVGRIDSIDRLDAGGLGNALGVFDTHADAVEAARQVGGRFLTGVSGDVDKFTHELAQGEDGGEEMHITHGRLVAATLVAKPAFQEASIEILSEEGEQMPPVITAAGGPVQPPAAWFADPHLSEPTMLTVEDSGRVYGHIAEWGTPHLGNPRLKPPRSQQNYRYFNRKPVRTAEGADVFTGQLTLIGGHAELSMDPEKTVKHYDDTRSAVSDVVAGEDEFGIWVAGAMRPGLSDNQLRAFRASEPSGDWRMRDGNLELCAVCQVNVAGFPVNARPRALVASGEVVALVAAGMVGYAEQRSSTQATIEGLQQQISAIIAEQETQKRAALAQIIQTALAQI